MAGQPRYAGFWIRFLALILDTIIIGVVWFAVIKLTGAITVTCPADTVDLNASCPGGVTTFSPIYWVMNVLIALYWVVLWAFGGTLAQRALGLSIVNANTGSAPGIGRAILRLIGFAISEFVIFIGLIWVAFDPRKQGWHDKIAGTVVVRKSK